MQVIRFAWKNFTPSISMDDGTRVEIMGKQMTMRVGAKRCIGYARNGAHQPCPHNALASNGYYCNYCRVSDDFFLCVKCNGSECINRKQRAGCEKAQYFVYLASFSGLIKVGISQQHRFLERLVEQGADFAAKICQVKDGKEVRLVENRIREELSIVDSVTGKEKNALLFADPNAAISSMLAAVRSVRSNGFAQHLIDTEIYDLRHYYGLDGVAIKPQYKELHDGMQLSGRVAAVKGNLIIMEFAESANSFSAINAHSLVGRDVYDFKVQ